MRQNFLESSAESSHIWFVLPNVLHKGHLEEEVISEVKFAGETIQGVKQRTNLKILQY